MRRLLKAVTFALALFAVACSNGQSSSLSKDRGPAANSGAAIPAVALTGRVTDAANILTRNQQAALSDKLERLEQRTKHQMVVVTVPTLHGRDVADFTKDLANAWGIGRKGHNDGVVLLVAPNEHKVRIAVGYGLEGLLTHDVCQQIIDRTIVPHFRQGDLGGGIQAGTDALIAKLS